MLKTTVIYVYPVHCIQLIIDHFSFSYMVGIMVTAFAKLDIVGPNVNVVQVRNVLQKIKSYSRSSHYTPLIGVEKCVM